MVYKKKIFFGPFPVVGNGISEPSRPVISKILFSYTFGHQGAQKRSQQGGALKNSSKLKVKDSVDLEAFFFWLYDPSILVQVAQNNNRKIILVEQIL